MIVTPQERRYQLQSGEGNRQIEALLDGLHVSGESRPLYAQLLTTVLKMYEDGADLGDLKIANNALKELRYAFKVFSPYKGRRKVTVFGSARTARRNGSPSCRISLTAGPACRSRTSGSATTRSCIAS